MLTSAPSLLGIRCTLHPLTDGRVIVLPRERSQEGGGMRSRGPFSGPGDFRVVPGMDATTVVAPRPPSALSDPQAEIDTRIPWVPSAWAAWGPDVIPPDADLPLLRAGTYQWEVIPEPDLSLYRPIYGVGHSYFLVITVDGAEVFASSVLAGDSGTGAHDAMIDAAGDEIVTVRQLYVDATRATLIMSGSYTYTQDNP